MIYKFTKKLLPVVLISLAASTSLQASRPFPSSSSDDEMDLTASTHLTPAQDVKLEQDVTQLLAQANAPFTQVEIKKLQEASERSQYPGFIQHHISINHERVLEPRTEIEWPLENSIQTEVPSDLMQRSASDTMELD